jgi:hypothetical protein
VHIVRLATVAVITLAACRSPVEPATSPVPDDPAAPAAIVAGVVTAERVSGGVRLKNGDDHPVAYAVWNPDFLGLFAPCTTTGPACPRLGPGASVVVRDADVTGTAPGMRRVVVRWWHVEAGRADAVREVEVEWSGS